MTYILIKTSNVTKLKLHSSFLYSLTIPISFKVDGYKSEEHFLADTVEVANKCVIVLSNSYK